MSPNEICQSKAAPDGSSLYYVLLFLPDAQRCASTAIHAFYQEVSTILEKVNDPGVAQTKLAWWHEQITFLFLGRAQHPVLKALQPYLHQYDLAASLFHKIIDGVEAELYISQFNDWPQLKACFQQAHGAVETLCAHVYGYQNESTLEYARHLGLALRLSTMVRDIGLNARNGRIYLPQQELERFNVSENDVFQRRYSPEFKALMKFQAARARYYFGQAAAALTDSDRRSQRPGLLSAALANALRKELERDDWRVLEQQLSLTPIRKFWLAWKTWNLSSSHLLRRLRQAPEPRLSATP